MGGGGDGEAGRSDRQDQGRGWVRKGGEEAGREKMEEGERKRGDG